MIALRKMAKNEIPLLYSIALRAFQSDYEKYGFYPPFMKEKTKSFLPPLMFGKVILADNAIIGGVFFAVIGKKGEIGTIFIDPVHQKKGYGQQVMLEIEKQHPKVKKWKLETLGESFGLHRFYEKLGYVKSGERKDPKSAPATLADIHERCDKRLVNVAFLRLQLVSPEKRSRLTP